MTPEFPVSAHTVRAHLCIYDSSEDWSLTVIKSLRLVRGKDFVYENGRHYFTVSAVERIYLTAMESA